MKCVYYKTKYVNKNNMELKKEDIKPCNESVLVTVKFADTKAEDGMEMGEMKQATKTTIEFYTGKVESLGERSTEKGQCPGLKVGDSVIFSQFAGTSVSTGDDYCKIVRGYDIVAITDENMEKENIKPTADRLLVEIIEEGMYAEDGMYKGNEYDPRERQTQRGKVLKSGPEAGDRYKEGTIVYFDPYCGNLIVNNNEVMLKTINTFDILFTL